MAEEKPAPEEQPTATSNDEAAERNGDPDFSKKHPLEYSWTLWFDAGSAGKAKANSWGSSLRAVYTFSTVEDFWSLYNNIATPSRLSHGMDLHMFKSGIEPKWEDPKCEHGGKWTALVPKSINGKAVVDVYWLHALLACIGEQFEEGEEVCGVVVNIRQKQDRVCLWTKSAANEAVQVSLGKQFKQVLDIPETTKIGYLTHKDAKAGDRRSKDKYQT